MDKQAVEILTKARALISKGWCQNASAVDVFGREVWAFSHYAVKWCIAGALVLAEDRKPHMETRKFLRLAIEGGPHVRNERYVDFNDAKGRKKSEVLAMLDKAIKLAKE